MKSSFLNGATLVFDLDGTLVDTAPDLIGTLNHVLSGSGHPDVAESYMRPFISFGARRMIAESLAVSKVDASDDEIDELLDRFLAHYGANVAVQSSPYPNVLPVLQQATQSGARLGVCTNKREDLSLSLLKAFNLHGQFDAIVGRDTLDVCKPNPRHLTETIARTGGDTGRAIMIGDSPTDVETARAAGLPVVAVSFGYSEVPPEKLGADALIHDYAELMNVLLCLLER